MKIVYMGTPDFAVPSLEALVRAGHNVACVVTQPDAVRDRGKKVKFSPVKEKAVELGLPSFAACKSSGRCGVSAADAGTRTGSHRRSGLWTDPAEGDPGSSEIWMP